MVSGGGDNTVRRVAMGKTELTEVGTHQAPVSCIATDDEAMPHMVVSGSWDKTVAVWDLRASRRAHEIVLPDKVGLGLGLGLGP